MRSRKKQDAYFKKKKEKEKIASSINIFNPYSDRVEDICKNLISVNPSCFLVVDQQTNLGLLGFLLSNDSIETKEYPTYSS